MTSSTCAACGTENEPGRKFCGECGAPLARVCPACGAPNAPTVKFCGECGSALQAATASAPAVEASAESIKDPVAANERRLVSVLFADLVGFTSLSEARDAEEVRDLLSRYFETCRELVERYGGTVEKFIGDAVMAVWGTPVANEDDAERAVRTAIDVVEAVSALGGEVGAPDLRARAGIVTGEASVNLAARGEGMVAGDLVNTASRVQAAAEAGTVLVGEATRRSTEAAVVYADAGTHELKGKAEPVQLWQALRVTAGRGGLMRSEGLEPPFVGRSRELRLVKDLFHACTDERQAHLVQVTGIAGIGKSRLAWEFFKYIDGLEELLFWHRGRCLAYGEGVTYWALAEMVRGRADILEGADRGTALAKLRATLEEHVLDPAERKFVEPRLAQLLGLEERGAYEKTDLFAGWRLFFERLAAENPVAMVFEDLQWADPSLLEFIDYLLEWSRAFPIFVVTLSRPEGAGSSLAASRRNATSIYLEPLPAGAMEQLLDGLVPGLPPQLRATILERSEGVPLYAVETVRMLLDRGLLVQEGPVYRPAGEVGALEIPETLHALIAARLDGLPAEERRLVQDAAVLGKTFPAQALAAVAGAPEREVEPLLASLVAKELLSVQADPRSPERGQYGFLQDLVRTVAYETLSRKDRRQKHLAAAAYLEGAWGDDEDEIVEVVAAHYVDAYRLAPDADDAAEIGDKARRMLVKAGERAASLGAASEARTYFQQGAELTDSEVVQAELKERAGQMAFLEGNGEVAERSLKEAIELFTAAGQPHAAARVEAWVAEVEFTSNRLDQAVERIRRAHEVLAADEPDPDFALVTGQLGRFLVISGGRDDEATAALEQALELAEHLQLPDAYSHALSSRGILVGRRARLDEATTLLQRALDVALENDLPGAAQRAYNNLAWAWEQQDRHAAVAELGDQALAMNRRAGNRTGELSWITGSIETFIFLGRWDEALALAEELPARGSVGAFEWSVTGAVFVALIYARRGELRRAHETLDTYSQLATSDNPELLASYAIVRSEILAAEGNYADAVAVAEGILAERDVLGIGTLKRVLVGGTDAALDLRDGEKADELLEIVRSAKPGEVGPYLRAHAARLEARLAALRGDDSTVEQGFAAAAERFRELEMPFERGAALVQHGEWLAAAGRQDEADPLLADAREIFEALGATPWVERVERAAATPLRAETPA